ILGVMFVSGAFVLTDSLGKSFNQLFAGIFANVDVRVTATPKLNQGLGAEDQSGAATVPQATVNYIRDRIPGVADAQGGVVVEGAGVIGSNGKAVSSVGPPRFGVDWASQQATTVLREGTAPTADNQIAINAALAKTAGLHVGDQVGVLTVAPGKRTFDLVG